MPPLVSHLISLLHELAHGPDIGADYGHFSEPEAGLLPTLAQLNPAQASALVAKGRPPLTAFAAHLTQLLTFAAGQLEGNIEFPDFAAPWRIGAVSDAEWQTVQHELITAFAALQSVLQRRELETEEVQLAQTALTHAAYHAGALRFHAANLQAQA